MRGGENMHPRTILPRIYTLAARYILKTILLQIETYKGCNKPFCLAAEQVTRILFLFTTSRSSPRKHGHNDQNERNKCARMKEEQGKNSGCISITVSCSSCVRLNAYNSSLQLRGYIPIDIRGMYLKRMETDRSLSP